VLVKYWHLVTWLILGFGNWLIHIFVNISAQRSTAYQPIRRVDPGFSECGEVGLVSAKGRGTRPWA